MKQQDTFLYTCTSGFLITFLISRYRVCRIFFCKVNISDSIIYLVKIFAIVSVASHSLEARNHLLCLSLSQHLSHRDAGIKGQLIRRALAKHLLKSFICFLLMSHTTFYLSQQVVFTRPLFASHFMFYNLTKIFCCFVEFFCMKIVVTKGIIPFLLRPPVDTVALHIANYIFCIIEKIILYKTFCQPSPCLTIDSWLTFIESRHIGKGSSSLFELTLIELGAPHQHPGTPNKWIILFPGKPLYVFRGLATILIPFWFCLYAMKLNSLLRLCYSHIIIRLTQISRRLIANGIER